MIFKAVRDGRPYPEHGYTLKQWAEIPPRPVSLNQLITIKLEMALDHDRGGQIAASLQGLYDYARRRLVDANLSKEPEPLEEVTRIIGDLRDAWAASVVGGEAS